MKDGKVMQIGSPREIYERPANRFVASFIGTTNFIEGRVTERTAGETLIDTPHGAVLVTLAETAAVGEPILLAVRPEGIDLAVTVPGATARSMP